MLRNPIRDPRRAGGRYYNGYWRQFYTVLSISDGVTTEATDDGRILRHRTAWDNISDYVIVGDRAYSYRDTMSFGELTFTNLTSNLPIGLGKNGGTRA